MLSRQFSLQKGFSLIRFAILLLTLLGFAVLVFSILPRLLPGSGIVEVINSLSQRAQNLMSGLTQKFSAIGHSLASPIDKLKDRIDRAMEDLKDWWYLYKTRGAKISRSLEWDQDMYQLIQYAEQYGYNMKEVRLLWDRYNEHKTSAKRVEKEFWNQIQGQTAAVISANVERFRDRPLGCSDFTDELTAIWTIQQKYNAETGLDSYIEARLLSQELDDPRSLQFVQEIFGWIGFQDWKWFMEQFVQALPVDNQRPDYPKIVEKIDTRMQNATNPFECILGNITVAEIYLNYDLIDPAQNRFDQAIRDLAGIFTRYGSSIPLDKQVGLHMALGMLNERMCRNNDLAIKEFKDAIAAARKLALKCEHYNLAHYHLGIINLKLRDAKVQPDYVSGTSTYSGTTEQLYEATPAPTPTPIPTPTPSPNPIKIEIEIPTEIFRSTAKMADGRTRAIPLPSGVTKGDIELPRPLRENPLRPRTELGGETQKMKTFNIDQFYDLTRIPAGAIREFESYLQCSGQGPRADVARYIIGDHKPTPRPMPTLPPEPTSPPESQPRTLALPTPTPMPMPTPTPTPMPTPAPTPTGVRVKCLWIFCIRSK